MVGNVLTRLGLVGGVDSRGDTSGGDATKVRKEPVGAVKAQDIDAIEFVTTQGNQGNSKRIDLFTIFLPRPNLPFGRILTGGERWGRE